MGGHRIVAAEVSLAYSSRNFLFFFLKKVFFSLLSAFNAHFHKGKIVRRGSNNFRKSILKVNYNQNYNWLKHEIWMFIIWFWLSLKRWNPPRNSTVINHSARKNEKKIKSKFWFVFVCFVRLKQLNGVILISGLVAWANNFAKIEFLVNWFNQWLLLLKKEKTVNILDTMISRKHLLLLVC